MKSSASSSGMTSPSPTSGQVVGRPAAWRCNSSSPVRLKTTQAAAKISMNQLQAVPVLRPLCRSLR